MQNNHFVFFLYISFTILLSPRLICKLNISENAIAIISIGDSFETTYRKIASKKILKSRLCQAVGIISIVSLHVTVNS